MKKILLSSSLALLLLACKKNVSELPEATQTGAHTFGAKVDGAFWVPKGFGPFPANDILESHFRPGSDFVINARNFSSSPTETEFEIYIDGATGPGVYPLNSERNAGGSYAYYVKRTMTPSNEWVTNAQYTGAVTITKIDSVNRFVSGTFYFNMINLYNNPQPLAVTEGRFDVKYQ